MRRFPEETVFRMFLFPSGKQTSLEIDSSSPTLSVAQTRFDSNFMSIQTDYYIQSRRRSLLQQSRKI